VADLDDPGQRLGSEFDAVLPDESGHLVRVERLHLDGDFAGQRRRRATPTGPEERDRAWVRAAERELQRGERRRVTPLQVVNGEQCRLMLRERADQRGRRHAEQPRVHAGVTCLGAQQHYVGGRALRRR
jgi:hypothetical protein